MSAETQQILATGNELATLWNKRSADAVGHKALLNRQ
jgi:hypothetical protein